MSEFVLEMRDVVKRFPGVLAVNKAQLDLKPGEVHCLVGVDEVLLGQMATIVLHHAQTEIAILHGLELLAEFIEIHYDQGARVELQIEVRVCNIHETIPG